MEHQCRRGAIFPAHRRAKAARLLFIVVPNGGMIVRSSVTARLDSSISRRSPPGNHPGGPRPDPGPGNPPNSGRDRWVFPAQSSAQFNLKIHEETLGQLVVFFPPFHGIRRHRFARVRQVGRKQHGYLEIISGSLSMKTPFQGLRPAGMLADNGNALPLSSI